MRPSFLPAITLVTLLVLGACEPTVATRGNLLDADRLSQIAVGSTKEEVAAKLGSPTVMGSFDEKVWYYVGRQTEQTSFLDPKVTQQKAVAVRFDDDGKVTEIKDLDTSHVAEVKPVDRTTPTYGQDNTFIQQLLGNLSRPMPAKANSRQ